MDDNFHVEKVFFFIYFNVLNTQILK